MNDFGEFNNMVAVVTGAAGGIGRAVAFEMAKCGVKGLGLVDRDVRVREAVEAVNTASRNKVAAGFEGDVTDETFRKRVYAQMREKYGLVNVCIPAAGITRDALAVKIEKETSTARIYPVDHFRQVMEVNLIAPIYWALELVARIAEDRKKAGRPRWDPAEQIQGTIIFIGSISSLGNKGQIAYAAAKAGLEGAAATLTAEAMFYGIRCGVIHPGFTDTPMVRALGEDFISQKILPQTQLRRLIQPKEIAEAICFLIDNPAVSGELWADAGWHPSA